MTEYVDCAVVGAGVVGLAVARELAQAGIETILLERELLIGSETSSRNSEVIHAGIYYPPGSLKAELCVQGKHLLYAHCESHQIEYRGCGKLIVATAPDQIDRLRELENRAKANGVTDLEWLASADARTLEPELSCVAALLSPSTGIVDSHALMLSLQGDFEAAGGMLAFGAEAASGLRKSNRFLLQIDASEPMQLSCSYLVNCAGLHAQSFAGRLADMPRVQIPALYYAKGNYFTYSGPSPFSRLIYPAPETASLGLHLGLDMSGAVRFGPDVEWTNHINYDVDPARSDLFYAAIRQYWPGLPDSSLTPGYAGMRPKLHGPGQAAADFVIQDAGVHGVDGLVNLFGIESPGLTSALAIAERVRELLFS